MPKITIVINGEDGAWFYYPLRDQPVRETPRGPFATAADACLFAQVELNPEYGRRSP